MAPTRRSTRAAKPTDQEATKATATSSPSTRATRAKPAPKSPVTKQRAKTTRKTTSKVQAEPEVEEKEEKEEKEEEEEQVEGKPKARGTRKAAPKTKIVPEIEDEKEIITQEEMESVVAAATRRSNRTASIASLQSPAKSKAARGRVAKKTAPAKRARGVAIAEDSNEVVPDVEEEGVITPKAARGERRKSLAEAVGSPTPTAAKLIEEPAVVIKVRAKRGTKKSKDPIEEPVAAESPVDASATPSWAKKRGGRRAKAVEDVEMADVSSNQQNEVGGAEAEVAKIDAEEPETAVEDTNIGVAEPEPAVTKGKGRKKGKKMDAVVKEPEVIVEEIAEPEPVVAKGRGGRKGKKVDIVVEEPEPVEETKTEVAEPEPVAPKGRGRRGKKADVVVEEPEAIVEEIKTGVVEPEPVAAKGRGGRKGKKVEAVVEGPEINIEVVVPESATKGKGRKKGKKAAQDVGVADNNAGQVGAETEVADVGSAVVEEPEAIIKEAAEPEVVIAKGRGRRKGKKTEEPEAIVEDIAEPEPVAAKGRGGRKGKKVGFVAEEPPVEETKTEVAEPEPVAKGRGGRKGKKVDAVAAEPEAAVETNTAIMEPEPVVTKGRGGRKGKKIAQEVEVEEEAEVAKVDTVAEDAAVAIEQPEAIVEDTEIDVAEPVVKGKGRKKATKAPARKNARKGRKAILEVPEAEMSDADVAQTQETEADIDVEAEKVELAVESTTAGPTIKDSGVFLEDVPTVEEKPESITEQSVVTETIIEESKVVVQESNAAEGEREEPIVTVQSEITIEEIETEITVEPTIATEPKPVAVAEVDSNAEQAEIVEETKLGLAELSKKAVTKSPGRVSTPGRVSKKKTPKGKGKAKAVVSVEDAEVGEQSIVGEKSGSNIGSESAIEKPSSDIKMPESDAEIIGAEPEDVARTPKPRKKAKKSAATLKKERQARAAAKKTKSELGSVATSDAITSDIVEDDAQPTGIEEQEVEVTAGRETTAAQEEDVEEAQDEEGEPDLPQPLPSPVARPTIILSPRRATPDPDLDPIKTPVPSSPIDRRMSHPLNSSPLRQNNPDTLVLSSPRQVTTPSSSPSKKRPSPNTRTPISRLSESGSPFTKNLEDSRDVVMSSITTPARGQTASVASSPIMMPPATPNVVAGDARSPTKQTPTKEVEAVGDVVMLGEVSESSLLAGRATNTNSSPVKNSSPIKAASEVGKSSPVGRLSFGGPEISQSSPLVSSPLVGRLEMNDPNLLLSSPLAVSSKTFSPMKAQQSSPTRSSPLKHSPLAMGSEFLSNEIVDESSFASFDGDYNRIDEPDDDVEGEEEYEEQEVFEYGEEQDGGKEDNQSKNLPTIEGRDEEESVDFDTTIDESQLFKLAEKAMLEGGTHVEPEVEEQKEEEEEEEETEIIAEEPPRNILTSRVSDLEISCLEQVHPQLDSAEAHVENVQTAPGGEEADAGKETGETQNKDVAEGDLTFSDCIGDESIPSSPILDITSPIKFEYRPTNEIFPSKESDEVAEEEQQNGPFSPIDMDFFGNRSFDTSAADWEENEEEEEEDEDDEEEDDGEEPDMNSPGGRLRHFRASSPPNIWPVDEQPGDESVDSEAPVSPVPKAPMPWDQSDFDFSEEFIRPPTESPEPGDFDFSKDLLPHSSPTSEKSVADNAEGAVSPAADKQTSSPATKDASPITFEAGGVKTQPIAKARRPKPKADTWLGKKGLQPREEKEKGLPALEKPAGEEEDTTEMKGGKRVLTAEGDGERTKRIKKDTGVAPELEQAPTFLLPESTAGAEGVEKGRRQTFGGRPVAKATGPLKRRKSFPETKTVPDRQSYLYASDPERILRHWAQHEKDQTDPESAVPGSPVQSTAVNPIETSASDDTSSQRPVRPSPTPAPPRRLRSVPTFVPSPSTASGPPSSPPSTGKGKRKADEPLDTGRAAKSSIPVSRRLARRPFNSKTQEEVDLVKKNTEHNALYSCKLDYEPVRKSGKRPPSLDHNEIQRVAAEARRKRREAEELGLVLRPGEDEAYVAVEEQGEGKGVKWDDQLEYGCGSDISEKPRSRELLPGKGILAVKPRLNVHGNWVPTLGAPPLRIPEELVVVKKIVYKGEEESGGKKGGKK